MFSNFNRDRLSQSWTGLQQFADTHVWRPLFGAPEHSTRNTPLPVSAPLDSTAATSNQMDFHAQLHEDISARNDTETGDVEMEESEGSFYTAQDSLPSTENVSSEDESFHTAQSVDVDGIKAIESSAATRYRPCEYDAMEAFGGGREEEVADPVDPCFAPDHPLRLAIEHAIRRLSALSSHMHRGPRGDTFSTQGRASDQSDSPQTPPGRVLYGAYTWPPIAGLDLVHEYIRNPAALRERVADQVFPTIPASRFEQQSPTQEDIEDYIRRSGRGDDPNRATEDAGLPPHVLEQFYAGLTSAETLNVNDGAQEAFEAPADFQVDVNVAVDANAGFVVEHQEEPASNNGDGNQGPSEPPYAIMTENPLFDRTRPTTIGRPRVAAIREAETVAEGSTDRRKRVRAQDNQQFETTDSPPLSTVVTPLRRSRRRTRKTSCKECIGCSYSKK